MRRRVDPPPELLQLAEHQDGALTLEQASALGLGPRSVQRLVREGRWQRLGTGVLLTDAGTPSWPTLAWAGVLRAGDRACVGGWAAAHLHGLTDDPPDVIDIWSREQLRVDEASWRFRREGARTHGRTSTGSPPRLSVEDTVLDVCDELGVDEVPGLLIGAVQQRRTTPARLRRELGRRRRVRHRAAVEAVLGDVDAGVESPLERLYLHRVERAHSLPTGQRQHRSGGRRRDVAYPEHGVVVELDGRFHEGAGRFRDMTRDNASMLSGERTLRFGWTDVHSAPCRVAAQVGQLLTLGGWPGPFERCPSCRLVPTVCDLTA